MFKVEYYQNPNDFFLDLQLESNSLHLTGDSSFRLLLRKTAGEETERRLILTYGELQQILDPEWTQPLLDLQIQAEVKQILRSILTTPEEAPYLKGLERSLHQWVEMIRFLVELGFGVGVPPVDSSPTRDQELFYRVWQRLIQTPTLKEVFQRRQQGIVNHEKLYRIAHQPIKKIYVYHMIHLDASRVTFFQHCVESGIQVVFRIPYDPRLPEVYRPWTHIYRRIAPISKWHPLQESELPGSGSKWNAYLSGQGAQQVKDDRRVKFTKFRSPVHFVKALEQAPVDTYQRRYVTNGSKQLNQMFRGQMSEGNSEMEGRLAELPCNRFFLALYQCKKREGTIELRYEDLVECITSGWIATKEINGLEASSLLLDLEPYMAGVKTIDQVLERLETIMVMRDVSEQFDQLSSQQTGRSEVKKYLTNPFRAFPYVHRSRSSMTLKQLQQLVLQFRQVATLLLPEEGKMISISSHLDAIYQLFRRVKETLPLKENERNLMEDVLRIRPEHVWLATQEECLATILVLLQRGIHGEVTAKEDLDNIDQLEGLLLQTDEIHLTGMSMHQFASYRIGKSIEPLTFTWLKQWGQQDQPSRQAKLIQSLYTHYELNAPSVSFLHFQLYYLLAFAKGEVTISWIEGIHPYDEASSMFESLHALYGESKEVEPFPMYYEEFDFEMEVNKESEPSSIGNLDHLIGQIPIISWIDQDFCNRKFYLNTMIESHPIYESDFHQRIAFSIIGKIFAQQYEGEQGVSSYLFPLFPQWTQTLKRNLIDRGSTIDFLTYRSFQKISYPKRMANLQRLYSQYIVTKKTKVKNAYNNKKNNDRQWLKEWKESLEPHQVKAEPGGHCKMCPYAMVCDKGEFAIDRQYS